MRTAVWTPLYWEPVSGTRERIMAGVVVLFDEQVTHHRLIRDDILDAMFGKAAGSPKSLIDSALAMASQIAIAAGLESLRVPVMGLYPGETRITEANSTMDAVRAAALLYSSLANLDRIDDAENEDAPTQEETNRTLVSEVKEIVLAQRPALREYFNKTARIFPDGEPIRFGFMSPKAVIHYGVLHPVRQPSSVRDARARLFELSHVSSFTGGHEASLIIAVPRIDDATIGPKQKEALRRNQREIEREADKASVRLRPVHTATEAAHQTMALA